tara:strand:+ start:405 stop:704 length:300 start_codon:yes stop_codon:yes gene_type:complete
VRDLKRSFSWSSGKHFEKMLEDIGVTPLTIIAPNVHPKIAFPISKTDIPQILSNTVSGSPNNMYEPDSSTNDVSKNSHKPARVTVKKKAFHPPPHRMNK